MKQPEPLYKLLDWIHTNKIDWVNLSKNSNPNVISFLEKILIKLIGFIYQEIKMLYLC